MHVPGEGPVTHGAVRQGRRGGALNQSGFTLIEFLLVIIIIGVVAGIVSVTLRQGSEEFEQVTSRTEALSRIRFGLDSMGREIREAKSGTVSTWTATSFEFDKPDPDNPGSDITICFQWAGGPVNPLVRSVGSVNCGGGTSNDLVDDITSMSFTYYTSSGGAPAAANQIKTLYVDLTVTAEGESVNLVSTIFPRDF